MTQAVQDAQSNVQTKAYYILGYDVELRRVKVISRKTFSSLPEALSYAATFHPSWEAFVVSTPDECDPK